jgi:hypothetical protein
MADLEALLRAIARLKNELELNVELKTDGERRSHEATPEHCVDVSALPSDGRDARSVDRHRTAIPQRGPRHRARAALRGSIERGPVVNRSRTREQNGAVAAYATVEGAEKAVAHLVGLGYDEHDVGIAPRDFEVVGQHPMRHLLGRWLRVGFVAGLAAMTVIAVSREIGGTALVDSVLPLIGWGGVIGGVVGLLSGIVAYQRHHSTGFLTPPEVIAPTRYEVVVDRDRDRARHGLAQWWDPEAPPA